MRDLEGGLGAYVPHFLGEIYLLDRIALQHLLLTLSHCFCGVREQLGRDPGQRELGQVSQLPPKP